ncbi:phosphatidylglycerophosphate synthase [Chryseobacterium defluvii]|uniref:Phosphatidylglycerophosphate synthase n=1 Tax=Chryseobacterium defluvii TaxID=160396 RepID=A0A840KKQ6_9FLAO|nr:hypothetical protein [Chryseobacterium defluvii]MBB4808224.1 phosphatidylglycerophosphate synthase [Chryseobacterium defluvii]
MKKIKFSFAGKYAFFLSFLLGTLLLAGYILTRRTSFVEIGFIYVISAFFINIPIFLNELLEYLKDIASNKANGNSAFLILMNIPIAILYFFLFLNFF